MIQAVEALSTSDPFVGYAYAYPHKSAYRHLEPAEKLEQVWEGEQQSALFLYFHIPFCEYRCGFCNLFALAGGEEGLVASYLEQLAREAEAVREALHKARFVRMAIGGGTPTFLEVPELERLLAIAERMLGPATGPLPVSCEGSPATLTAAKAALLRGWGVERLSLGVQTFDDRESRSLGRPQRVQEVEQAIEIVRATGFPVLNLDLIYGGEGQSLDSWLRSVRRAISYRPEEIYLYPLYVREQTGLGRRGDRPGDQRLAAYRLGREQLLAEGYVQRSLRMFELPRGAAPAQPLYCCQNDGMVGLGCGARSYTRSLHYSTEYAVERSGVRAILASYLERPEATFRAAFHGFRLDAEEQRRRFTIQSLLQAEGISLPAYRSRFGSELLLDLPQLHALLELGLAECSGEQLVLNQRGLELSDAIGPWLYSPRVRALMGECACR